MKGNYSFKWPYQWLTVMVGEAWFPYCMWHIRVWVSTNEPRVYYDSFPLDVRSNECRKLREFLRKYARKPHVTDWTRRL